MTTSALVKRIVIRIRNPTLFNRYQILKWYTDHLFSPAKIDDLSDNNFQVLDLITFAADELGSRKDAENSGLDDFGGIHTRHSTIKFDIGDRLFQLNLKTEIVTVMDKIKVAFLVDSNFSMKTGDSRIHSSVAYETMCKTINGLLKTYQFTNSITNELVKIEPEVIVSVIAENQSSDFIPMRSYLHNQKVNEQNMMSIFESLYLEMIEHETDLINLQVMNLIGQI